VKESNPSPFYHFPSRPSASSSRFYQASSAPPPPSSNLRGVPVFPTDPSFTRHAHPSSSHHHAYPPPQKSPLASLTRTFHYSTQAPQQYDDPDAPFRALDLEDRFSSLSGAGTSASTSPQTGLKRFRAPTDDGVYDSRATAASEQGAFVVGSTEAKKLKKGKREEIILSSDSEEE
jgi:hypothetical protein